ncbi:hypothetical protein BDF22DRAFT_746683 [Syncephalis plumigaleata]|nr:hypothetical protein BDF22DRAFT_746683 [Syncephalis plumigaleata]
MLTEEALITVWHLIVQNSTLSVQSLVELSVTCTHLRRIVTSANTVWQQAYWLHFGSVPTGTLPRLKTINTLQLEPVQRQLSDKLPSTDWFIQWCVWASEHAVWPPSKGSTMVDTKNNSDIMAWSHGPPGQPKWYYIYRQRHLLEQHWRSTMCNEVGDESDEDEWGIEMDYNNDITAVSSSSAAAANLSLTSSRRRRTESMRNDDAELCTIVDGMNIEASRPLSSDRATVNNQDILGEDEEVEVVLGEPFDNEQFFVPSLTADDKDDTKQQLNQNEEEEEEARKDEDKEAEEDRIAALTEKLRPFRAQRIDISSPDADSITTYLANTGSGSMRVLGSISRSVARTLSLQKRIRQPVTALAAAPWGTVLHHTGANQLFVVENRPGGLVYLLEVPWRQSTSTTSTSSNKEKEGRGRDNERDAGGDTPLSPQLEKSPGQCSPGEHGGVGWLADTSQLMADPEDIGAAADALDDSNDNHNHCHHHSVTIPAYKERCQFDVIASIFVDNDFLAIEPRQTGAKHRQVWVWRAGQRQLHTIVQPTAYGHLMEMRDGWLLHWQKRPNNLRGFILSVQDLEISIDRYASVDSSGLYLPTVLPISIPSQYHCFPVGDCCLLPKSTIVHEQPENESSTSTLASSSSSRQALVYRLLTQVRDEPQTMIWEVVAFPSCNNNNNSNNDSNVNNECHASSTTPRILARGRFKVKVNPQGARKLTPLKDDPWPRRPTRSMQSPPIPTVIIDDIADNEENENDFVNVERVTENGTSQPNVTLLTTSVSSSNQTTSDKQAAAATKAIDNAANDIDNTDESDWVTAADIHARVLITAPDYYTSPAWVAVHSLRRNCLLWERQGDWEHAIPLPELGLVALITNWVPVASEEEEQEDEEQEEEEEEEEEQEEEDSISTSNKTTVIHERSVQEGTSVNITTKGLDRVKQHLATDEQDWEKEQALKLLNTDTGDVTDVEEDGDRLSVLTRNIDSDEEHEVYSEGSNVEDNDREDNGEANENGDTNDDGDDGGGDDDDDDATPPYGIIELVSLANGHTVRRVRHRWTSVGAHIMGSLCQVERFDGRYYVGDLLTGQRLRRINLLSPIVQTNAGSTSIASESDKVDHTQLGILSPTHYGYTPLKADGTPLPNEYRVVDVSGLS